MGGHDAEMEFASDSFKALVKENGKLKYQLAHLQQTLEELRKPAEFKFEDKPDLAVDTMRVVADLMRSTIGIAFPEFADVDPSITIPAAKVKNAGSYQCNAAMNINNKLKKQGVKSNPREVAQKIADSLPENPVVDKLEVAGPGFINVHVAKSFVQAQTNKLLRKGALAPPIDRKLKVIVDFSSPNIAKEMHVGHLRSTIIGESISRVLEFAGHETHRVNHVGDWGTQFGMLIAHLKDEFPDYKTKAPPIGDLQAFYKASKVLFDQDEEFKKRAYGETVKLQSGDPDVTLAWQLICDVSRREFQDIYNRLDVTIEEKGESFYQSRMQGVVEELTKKGLVIDDPENPGRKIAWTSAREQTNIPLIVVKSDGAYTYDTSDLATLRYRVQEEKADWVVYVVGQSQCSAKAEMQSRLLTLGSCSILPKVWDFESGEFERTLKGHTKAVNNLAFDKEGRMLASCSADTTIKLWNFETYTCVKTLQGHEHNVSGVCFDPSGDLLISASRDKTVRVFEVATGLCVRILEGHTEWVRRVDVSADGAFFVSGSNDHTVRVWDAKSGECRHVLTGHDHVVEDVKIAPQSATPAINTLVLGEETSEPRVAGPFAASGGRDRIICIWDVSTGQELGRLVGHDNWVRALAWHPGGKYLLSASDDKTVRVWDIATKRCVKSFPAHSHFVSAIAMQPKAMSVATGSVDLKVKFWDCS
ncbi:arginyl-tRNA synthetase [Salpingoeca rosetta]|uniref:arginine--tRNA ligase n=1 Tax=Salpingoeca rosetta (strain ATCC 50818 / BSB-021) TaxID=946362 RepID=F2USN0_SALR5|nr:arginyl-tRNA synthetase [Salpingoeca rosetta]EGD81139.1 arginyl-tRNA synthetase [Salpingoeca rosetta]|eukprot:XP_004987824.1 arginyl-tRNA synthetase [Salpingoeca rosetta]